MKAFIITRLERLNQVDTVVLADKQGNLMIISGYYGDSVSLVEAELKQKGWTLSATKWHTIPDITRD